MSGFLIGQGFLGGGVAASPAMSEDQTIEITVSSTKAEIEAAINALPKDLGMHSIILQYANGAPECDIDISNKWNGFLIMEAENALSARGTNQPVNFVFSGSKRITFTNCNLTVIRDSIKFTGVADDQTVFVEATDSKIEWIDRFAYDDCVACNQETYVLQGMYRVNANYGTFRGSDLANINYCLLENELGEDQGRDIVIRDCAMNTIPFYYVGSGKGTLAVDNSDDAFQYDSPGTDLIPLTSHTWDAYSPAAPTITGFSGAGLNTYVDVNFNQGVYGANDGSTPVAAADLSITNFSASSATGASISSITNTSDTALTGGESTIRVVLSFTGTPDGSETFQVQPTDGASIYNVGGTAMAGTETSGTITADDDLAPTLVSATIENAAPTDVVMVFSEVVTGTNLGFTLSGTTSSTFSSISGSGTNTITGVLGTAAANGETILLSYNSGTGDIVDGNSNALASFTDTAVTNNITGASSFGEELNTNYFMTASISPWTGTNWAHSTDDGGKALHTTGSTDPLTNAGILEVGKTYVIQNKLRTTPTAGSLTPTSGTTTGTAQTALGSYCETLVCAGNTNALFAPTTDYNGDVDEISIKEKIGDPNFIKNGTFDGATDLTLGTGYTVGSGVLSYDGANPYQQVQFGMHVNLYAGHTYNIAFDVTSGTATIRFKVLSEIITDGVYTTTGNSVQITPTTETGYFAIQDNNGAAFSIDNVVVTEVLA